MKKVILASFATIFTTVAIKAQDLEVVKKTIESDKIRIVYFKYVSRTSL